MGKPTATSRPTFNPPKEAEARGVREGGLATLGFHFGEWVISENEERESDSK